MKIYLYVTTADLSVVTNPGWGEVNFGGRTYSNTDYSYGCYAVHHITTEKIHLQTGKTGLIGIPWLDHAEAFMGWANSYIINTPLPCKIYVEKGGSIA
jgi:hypothetical protein